jgi:plastocyanin
LTALLLSWRIVPDARRNLSMSLTRAALALFVLAFAAVAGAQDVPLFKLVARDGKFEPAVLEVPAGTRVRIEVSNQNKKAIEFESKDLKQEKVIAPGSVATLTINPLKPGEYKFMDEFQQSTGQGKVVAR